MSEIKTVRCKNCNEPIVDLRQRDYCNKTCRLEYFLSIPVNQRTIYQKKEINFMMHEEANCRKNHDCICPQCGKLHVLKIYWSGGDMTPRIRCKTCKELQVYKEYEPSTFVMVT